MAAVLDVAQIERELKEINQQRSETRERLDALRQGRGRGRGPAAGGRGDGPRSGVFSRLGDMNGGPPREASAPGRPSVFDRLYSQGSRGSDRGDWPDRGDRDRRDRDRDDREGEDSSRQLSKRLSSRISSEVVGPARERREQQDADPEADRERRDPLAGRKRLLSAVMVNGQARQLSGAADRLAAEPAAAAAAAAAVDEPPAKRPTLAVDDKTKRRAARMFGTLLVGTLQKFQNDEQAFKKTDTAQRRAEMERRAQERAEAEAQRLREEATATWREERETKLNALHDLNLQADLKALQLRYAKRIQQRQQLVGFCITTTQPPLYWVPRQASKETAPLLQQSADAFKSWKQQQLEELEAQRAELEQQAAAKREAALARLAARQPPAPGEAAAGNEEENGSEGSEQEGAGEDGDTRADSQADGDSKQEQQDEDMQEAGEAAEEAQEEEAAQQVERRVRRSRPRGDDEDDERLLSSEEEDG